MFKFSQKKKILIRQTNVFLLSPFPTVQNLLIFAEIKNVFIVLKYMPTIIINSTM